MTDSSVRKIIARAGDNAELGFPVHPPMLRHALRLYEGQRRTPHERDSALPRPSKHSAHGTALLGAVGRPLQAVLE
jgi:hypothetical protein